VTTDQSTHPLGPDAPTEDYVGLAFGALAFSILLGLGLNAIVALVVRTLQSRATPASGLELGAPPALALLAGTFLACFAAAIAAWIIMTPIRNAYRQGMLAMVSFFGSFVVSMVTMPVDRMLGRAGLVGLAAVAMAAAFLIGRRLGRAPS